MAEQPDELKKLVTIATDLMLSVKLRIKSVEVIASMGNHDALLALLGLVANEQLTKDERELALKQAAKIIKSGY